MPPHSRAIISEQPTGLRDKLGIPQSAAIGTGPERSAWVDLLSLAVVVAQIVLSIQFANTASVTHDEYWHLPVGVLNDRTGRFDWERLNPPLIRMWAAMPIVKSDTAPTPAQPLSTGEYGDAFVKDHPDLFESLYRRGRFMMIALSAITTLILVGWSRSRFGSVGALLTAITWGLSPNTISHGSLITGDVAAALGFALVLWLLQRFGERPTQGRAILWGAALGFAQGLKFTSLLLYPLCIFGWLLLRREEGDQTSFLARWFRFLIGLVLSLIVLNAIFLFHGSMRRLDSFAFQSQAMKSIQGRLASIGATPVPLPEDFLLGVDLQRSIMEQQHPVYFEGEWYLHGVRPYYLMAMLWKLPLGTLALTGFSILGLLNISRLKRDWRTVLLLVVPAAGLIAIASFEDMQLGIRYILPSLALLSVFIGRLGTIFEQRGRWFRKLLILGVAGSCLLGLREHPHDLAYFNEYAGGSLSGRQLLADSNIDWGQDLDGLKQWLNEKQPGEIGLAYFGTVPPEALGIQYHLPPGGHPEPGTYAISVNYLVGRPHTARDGRGGSRSIDIGEFSYFQFFKPIAHIGSSIDVFEINENDVARWNQARAALPTR